MYPPPPSLFILNLSEYIPKSFGIYPSFIFILLSPLTVFNDLETRKVYRKIN